MTADILPSLASWPEIVALNYACGARALPPAGIASQVPHPTLKRVHKDRNKFHFIDFNFFKKLW
jgi:hypothetical protein